MVGMAELGEACYVKPNENVLGLRSKSEVCTGIVFEDKWTEDVPGDVSSEEVHTSSTETNCDEDRFQVDLYHN